MLTCWWENENFFSGSTFKAVPYQRLSCSSSVSTHTTWRVNLITMGPRNLKVFCRLASSNLLSSNNTNSEYSVMTHQGQYWRTSKSGKVNAIGICLLLTGGVWSTLTWTGLNTFHFKCGCSVPGLMLAVNLMQFGLVLSVIRDLLGFPTAMTQK